LVFSEGTGVLFVGGGGGVEFALAVLQFDCETRFGFLDLFYHCGVEHWFGLVFGFGLRLFLQCGYSLAEDVEEVGDISEFV
jgi:hypothetical protein